MGGSASTSPITKFTGSGVLEGSAGSVTGSKITGILIGDGQLQSQVPKINLPNSAPSISLSSVATDIGGISILTDASAAGSAVMGAYNAGKAQASKIAASARASISARMGRRR